MAAKGLKFYIRDIYDIVWYNSVLCLYFLLVQSTSLFQAVGEFAVSAFKEFITLFFSYIAVDYGFVENTAVLNPAKSETVLF